MTQASLNIPKTEVVYISRRQVPDYVEDIEDTNCMYWHNYESHLQLQGWPADWEIQDGTRVPSHHLPAPQLQVYTILSMLVYLGR